MKLLAPLALALCLTACATTQLNEAKAIDAGWSTLNSAAQVADQLAVSGKLHGAQAAKVKADLDQATQIMTAADAAYKQNPGTDVSAQIASAAALVSEVITITTGAKQ